MKKKKKEYTLMECKTQYFATHHSVRKRKKWYRKNLKDLYLRLRLLHLARRLRKHKFWFKPFDAVRWVLIDLLELKPPKFCGIYQFVALPGEGKTLSMVAHMERMIRRYGAKNIIIATNFGYLHENFEIHHWSDIINVATCARRRHIKCIIGVDEIHTTFDSSDWKSFPQEMNALLSFNRKFHLQFLCSAQIYDRIPKKVRDIANYTVICKNFWGFDRYFIDYYFKKDNYEAKFSGKRKLCDEIVTYVADDYLYSLYDTLQQVDRMTQGAEKEKTRKEEAFRLLFGDDEQEKDG